ncbi:DUF3363 domain-containing protein [Cupriavidus basilensis]|uniref:DUF3363 domain-containing protein n=1 Tax=Cupriavidus basilensis TaxID=68895 RepID=UPI003D35711D
MGLATELRLGVWAVKADAEPVLRAIGESGDIIGTRQRAMRGQQRDFTVFQPGESANTVIGRVAAEGLADELYRKGYLVVDGIDGKAHDASLPAGTKLMQFQVGAMVEARGSADVRAADKNVSALAADGLYRIDYHLVVAKTQASDERDPQVRPARRRDRYGDGAGL